MLRYFHNITFVTLVNGNCVFLRVLYTSRVLSRSITGYNELHDGFFLIHWCTGSRD